MAVTLDLLAKILRQAEAASTEEEAATYMAKAQDLATRASFDLEAARQHQANKEKRETPTSKVVILGEKRQKGLGHFIQLAGYIAAANDLEYDIKHNQTGVIVYGFQSDIDVFEALMASLLFQMESACAAFIKKGDYKNEMVTTYVPAKWSRYGDYTPSKVVEKPIHGLTARKSFQEAFARAAGRKVRDAAAEAKLDIVLAAEAAEQTAKGESSSASLVLVRKEVEVQSHYKAVSKAKGSWKGAGQSTVGHSSSGHSAGTSAGRNANIGGQRAIGGQRTALAS
jgi:hypothetical protein